MSLVTRLARGRLHYGWIIAGVTFLALLSSAGVRSTPSVLMVPLETEFGWSRATISLAVSINLMLFGLMGPFAVALIERIGVVRAMVGSALLVATGIGLTPWMTQSWQLILLWGVVVGAGTGMSGLALGAMVVNRWFTERRGLVMGMLTASTATGQLVFLPLMAAIVEAWGWRFSTILVAGAALVVVPLVALLMRDRPADIGLKPYGETGASVPHARATGNPIAIAFAALGRGFKSRDFWLLFLSFYICGASTNGLIGTHLIPACLDHGIAEVTAASLLAAMGIFDFFGTTLSGWLSDRYDNRLLLFWYYGLRGLSLLFLPFSFDLSFYGLSIFAVFYGLDWIATVPPTVRLAANSFGKENVGLMYGWIAAGHQLGAASAAFGAGKLRTELGSYTEAFMISGSLCLLAAILVMYIGRGARAADAGSAGQAAQSAAA
ncbi:MAG TPA: MFS transporter [Stellaceae bacterium]|nr:MFS transporter [Stellaceae bacterium]